MESVPWCAADAPSPAHRAARRAKLSHTFEMRPSSALNIHREAIRAIAASHRVSNVRVFGSVALGTDTEESDLDLLVDPTPQTTLFDIGALRAKLKALTGVNVDVLTPGALGDPIKARVLDQAQPL